MSHELTNPMGGAVALTRSAAFSNLFRKEVARWTQAGSWWVQPLVWFALLVGPLTLPLYLLREVFQNSMGDTLTTAHDMFFNLAAIATAVGAVLLTQGLIIGERQLGTLAWILSKPVPRPAVLLSKLTANYACLLAAALLAPGVAAYAMLSLEAGSALPVGRFVGALGLLALQVLFYVSLTLCLGMLTSNRTAVLAVPLAMLLGGDLVSSLLPALSHVTPWPLGRLAAHAALGNVPFSEALLPAVATVGWSALLVLLALIKFEREDF